MDYYIYGLIFYFNSILGFSPYAVVNYGTRLEMSGVSELIEDKGKDQVSPQKN